VASDEFMVEPTRFVSSVLGQAGQPVWEYRFSYVAKSLRQQTSGAGHASEIPYVFDTMRSELGQSLAAQDEQMARIVHAYWVQFAKTGDPNRNGLPFWPQYSAQKDILMNFTESGAVAETDPWKNRLDAIEKHLPPPSQ
jgi:para-nitrobenzyl esterase